LLAQSAAAPPSAPPRPAQAAPPPAAAPLPKPARRTQAAKAVWYVGLGALLAIPLVAIGIIGWAALSAFTIHRNVQAMIISTEPAASSAPTAAPSPVPTATIIPATATPAPTAAPPTPLPSPTAVPPTPTPIAPVAGAPVTVLLLGSDQRPGETDPARTDAIIIARIDPQQHRIAMLSLPRDLWVAIPGYGETRINAAHVWGQIYNDPAGGIGLAQKTVSNLLGIPIDYTIYIDFQGFIGAIDALGGVNVNVEKELYDPNFPTMDYGYTEAHFLPGPQQMDGATALMYSRIRHPDSDFARMHRQQAVLAGVLDTLSSQNVLQNLKQLEDVTTALRDYVKTDMPEERILGLSWALRTMPAEKIEHYFLDADMISFGVGNDRWAEQALPDALEALVQKLLGD
jgi:LCP family protein required for cell wall assembly